MQVGCRWVQIACRCVQVECKCVQVAWVRLNLIRGFSSEDPSEHIASAPTVGRILLLLCLPHAPFWYESYWNATTGWFRLNATKTFRVRRSQCRCLGDRFWIFAPVFYELLSICQRTVYFFSCFFCARYLVVHLLDIWALRHPKFSLKKTTHTPFVNGYTGSYRMRLQKIRTNISEKRREYLGSCSENMWSSHSFL